MPRRISWMRRVLAVLSGLVVMTTLIGILEYVLTNAVPAAFAGAAVPPGWLAVIAAGRFGAAFAGGWIAALFVLQAGEIVILALVGLVTVEGFLSAWMASEQPLWYRIAFLLVGTGGAYLGGQARLAKGWSRRERRQASR